MTYCWCQNLDQAQTKHELGLASSTSVDWDSFCREVCEITLSQQSETWWRRKDSADRRKQIWEAEISLGA